MDKFRAHVEKYAVNIGSDPMLIQGAGGNISWKHDGVLWVKASGTWLAEACNRNIFVGLNLEKVRLIASFGGADYSEAVLKGQALRPSIETALHALMPQKFVAHCHPIDVIAHCIVVNAQANLINLLDGLNWVWIDYVKPGAELALAVSLNLDNYPIPPDILILGNHGLVVAGQSLEELDFLLHEVLRRLSVTRWQTRPYKAVNNKIESEFASIGYQPSFSSEIQSIATSVDRLKIAQENWVLYPDHAVFLGESPSIYFIDDAVVNPVDLDSISSVCIIVPKVDVFMSKNASPNQRLMLSCYANVLSRLPDGVQLNGLSSSQVAELLNWDAEKYRQNLNSN